MRSSSLAETRPPRRATRHWTGASLGWVLKPWGRQFLAQPSKVLSTGASRARVTPVEGERDKPTLVAARHLGGRNSTGRRGFSCQQVAPATPMEGEGGKLLARIIRAQVSLAASLVDNNNTVAVAASTVSPSTTTTTGSTATSRTRDSTTRTRDSITRTRDSITRTRDSTT